MAVTIRDVAKRSGVSTATVSHALNGTGQVSRKTRQVVLAVVRELGYFPNAHARRLALHNSKTLGMIVSDIENPFFPDIMKSFQTRARHHGYDVIWSDTNYDPARMQRAAEEMLQHQVRGVAIMTSEMSRQLIDEITRRRIAVTFLDLGSAEKYVSTLRIDYSSGVEQVVRHLFQLGHRRMAFAGGRVTLKSNMARQQAYVDSMKSLNLDPGAILQGDLRFSGGLAAGHEVLKLRPMPTAVVAVNDLTAVGVMKALTTAGARVPEDVSVAGFDNTHLAEYVTPTLTTVEIHRELLGRVAADALHQLSSASDPQGEEVPIPAELVVRASTGPAA